MKQRRTKGKKKREKKRDSVDRGLGAQYMEQTRDIVQYFGG